MATVKAIIVSLRPKQWTKNLILFAGLLFSQNMFKPEYFMKVFIGFLLFSLLSGGIYLLNDVLDVEKDRVHPRKKRRPIPSGQLGLNTAFIISVILVGCVLFLSFKLQRNFGWTAFAYFALLTAYSISLKHIVIVDVLVISMGFVLRAVAGVVIIGVDISSWLVLCTILLALFLALGKRRHEVLLLESNAIEHRPILQEYSPKLLDQMISVVTASTVMAYALYTMSIETVTKFHTRSLSLTIPFVLYGIFRYLYLLYHRKMGGNPSEIFLSDKPLLINIALWVLTIIAILYYN